MALKKQIDPLYIIFEKHLYDNSYDTPQDFSCAVVGEYVEHLKTNGLLMPDKQAEQIIEDLLDEVKNMLIKKTYGCLSIEDYKQNLDFSKEEDRKLARQRYSQLKKSA